MSRKMVCTHLNCTINKPRENPFKPRYQCRPLHETLPQSVLDWMANNSGRKVDSFCLDEFSYDPAHELAWHMQPALQDKLPAEMLSLVKIMQRAGAAVLSSLERLGELYESLEEDEQKQKLRARDEKYTTPRPTPPVPFVSRSVISDPDDATSISTGATAGSASSGSIDSFCSDMTSRTTIPSRSSSTLALTEKRPVVSFTQSDSSNVSSTSTSGLNNSDQPDIKFKPTPLTTMTIPMESTAARAKYSAERFHLQTEALVRLSRSVFDLDREFSKYMRGHDQINSNINEDFVMDEPIYDEFEQWYRGKKAAVRALEDRGRAPEAKKFALNSDSPHNIN